MKVSERALGLAPSAPIKAAALVRVFLRARGFTESQITIFGEVLRLVHQAKESNQTFSYLSLDAPQKCVADRMIDFGFLVRDIRWDLRILWLTN